MSESCVLGHEDGTECKKHMNCLNNVCALNENGTYICC
jgi:hypothetical protein